MAPIIVPARVCPPEPQVKEQENNVSGDHAHHEHRPREPRQHERQPANRTDSEGGSNNRNRGRRSGSGGNRKSIYRFDDQFEHDICQLVTHRAPRGFPVIARSELATMPPIEVARTQTRILLCDGLHEGPHIWPNGDETIDESETTVIGVKSVEE
jgi:hypothetical protein